MHDLSGYLYPCIPERPLSEALTENPSILSAPCSTLGMSVHPCDITSFLAILTVVIYLCLYNFKTDLLTSKTLS